MKKINLIIVLVVLLFNMKSQNISIKEQNCDFESVTGNAIGYSLHSIKIDDVERELKRKLKSYKAKVKSKKGESFADNAIISDISQNTIDIYSKLEESSNGNVEMIIAFDLGGAFLNSTNHADKYNEAKRIFYEFSVEIIKKSIADKLKDEKKEYEVFVSDKENLIKENENLDKDIKNYEQKIKEAKIRIENNKVDIEETIIKIKKQNEKVKSVKTKLDSVK